MSQSLISELDDLVSLQNFAALCVLKHFSPFGGSLFGNLFAFLISNSFFPVFITF